MAKTITRTLLETVTERAEASIGPQKLHDIRGAGVSSNLWKEWETEWFRQADVFLEELKSEGLMKSYETLQGHVDSLRAISFMETL